MPDGYNKYTNPKNGTYRKTSKQPLDGAYKKIDINKPQSEKDKIEKENNLFGFYRKEGLPLVLAGPIIKRAEDKSIYFWICTSKQLKLGAKVFEGRAKVIGLEAIYPVFTESEETENSLSYKIAPMNKSFNMLDSISGWTEIGGGIGTTHSLGIGFFVSIIKAEPSPMKALAIENKFPVSTELSYEFFVLEDENSFKNAKLLFNRKERALITVDSRNDLSPSFSLQKNNSKKSDAQKGGYLTDFRDAFDNVTESSINAQDLRLAFGSCRKFHGEAKDCTIELFKQKYENKSIHERPNAVFFLGDQIYADDVSPYLINWLSSLGHTLLGGYESLPIIGPGIGNYLTSPKFANTIPPGEKKENNRRERINDKANFTSTDSYNHLTALGEFYAMYLLAYNDQLWPEYTQFTKLYNHFRNEEIDFSTKTGMAAIPVSQSIENPFSKEKENIDYLLKAKEGSKYMRKILANTPTYMICDDHEITDDWFITNEWKKTVSNNPLGARIVTNGICAYWFFQWLGNDPLNNEDPGELLNSIFWEKFSQSRLDETLFISDKEVIEKCTNYPNWSYVAPTIPATVFLDTRFNRVNTINNKYNYFMNTPLTYKVAMSALKRTTSESQITYDPTRFVTNYGDDLNKVAPILINNEQIEKLKIQLCNYSTENGIIISTPAPVFGLEFIEFLLGELAYPGKILFNGNRNAFMDIEREAWTCNYYNIDFFIGFLNEVFKNLNSSNNTREITILSGDVHYSFFNEVKISLDISNNKPTFAVNMLTSSGIKNPMSPSVPSIAGTEIVRYFNRKYDKNKIDYTLEISEYKRTESTFSIIIKPKDMSRYCNKDGVDSFWREGSFGSINGDKIEFIVP